LPLRTAASTVPKLCPPNSSAGIESETFLAKIEIARLRDVASVADPTRFIEAGHVHGQEPDYFYDGRISDLSTVRENKATNNGA